MVPRVCGNETRDCAAAVAGLSADAKRVGRIKICENDSAAALAHLVATPKPKSLRRRHTRWDQGRVVVSDDERRRVQPLRLVHEQVATLVVHVVGDDHTARPGLVTIVLDWD